MGFFDNFFGGGKNPATGAMPYVSNIPGMTAPMFNPYISQGQQALPQLQGQYGGLLNAPGQKLNEIGASYQQSPGLNFAIQKAMGGVNRDAARGGMAGSPMNQEQNIELATGYANQDYNNWLQHALGLYGQGLSGEQGLASGGLAAGTSMADMIANALQQSGNLSFSGQQNQNAGRNSLMSGIGTGLGALSAFTPWSKVGNLFGGGMGSSMYGGG